MSKYVSVSVVVVPFAWLSEIVYGSSSGIGVLGVNGELYFVIYAAALVKSGSEGGRAGLFRSTPPSKEKYSRAKSPLRASLLLSLSKHQRPRLIS